MTYKTSLFNKGLMISDFKRFWWFSALYGLFLLLLLPFQHLVQKVDIPNGYININNLLIDSLNIFSYSSSPQAVLICTFPIILAVLLFHYLHTSRATAVMHSLPFKRGTLYFSHCAAGLLLLLLPVLFTGLVLMVENAATNLHEYYSILNILQWMGLTALFTSLMFSIAVFVGMFTGNVIAHIAFSYILQVLPSGLAALLAYNLSRLVYGYAETINLSALKYNFPLMLFLDQGPESGSFTLATIGFYLLATVLFLAAAAYFYRSRHTETAGEIIAFSVMRPVFKYGVTVCTMLLAGIYFSGMSNTIIVLGYLLGSLFGYWTAEVLLQKSLRVWRAYKGYLGFAVITTVLLIVIATDATGYENRIPDPAQVQKVYFGQNSAEWIHLEKLKDASEQKMEFKTPLFFENQDNIKNIIHLHQQLLQHKHDTKKDGYRNVRYIIYTLNNGEYLIRQYDIDEQQYSSLLKPIYESLEYKQVMFPVVAQNPVEVKMIEIKDNRTPYKPVIIANNDEIMEFTSRLKQEMLSATFEELTSHTRDSVSIGIVDFKDKSMYYTLHDSYKSVNDWLKAEGYYQNIMLLPEEIDYAVFEYRSYSPGPRPTTSKRVEVRDPEVIKELLNVNQESIGSPNQGIIQVTFFCKGSVGHFAFIQNLNPDSSTSDALKGYIRQLD